MAGKTVRKGKFRVFSTQIHLGGQPPDSLPGPGEPLPFCQERAEAARLKSPKVGR